MYYSGEIRNFHYWPYAEKAQGEMAHTKGKCCFVVRPLLTRAIDSLSLRMSSIRNLYIYYYLRLGNPAVAMELM